MFRMILLAVFLQMSECILTPDGLMQPPGMKIFESTANSNRWIFEYSSDQSLISYIGAF